MSSAQDLTLPDGSCFVGCCGFGGNRQRYYRTLPLVEIQETFVYPPRQGTLAQWRRQAPQDFRFTMRAWQLITHEATTRSYRRMPKTFDYAPQECGLFRGTPAVAEAYQRCRQAAEALSAEAMLFETPPSFTPTQANRGNLAQFFETIERDNRLMVWRPRGVWNDEEVTSICQDLQLVPCTDLTQPPRPGTVAYLRLDQPRYDDDEIQRLAAHVASCSTAYCLFNSVNMARDAQRLVAALEPSI